MKIRLLIFSALLITNFLTAPIPKVEWTNAIGGAGNERANSISIDTKGNIVIAGRFQSATISIDQIPLIKNSILRSQFINSY